MSSDGSDKPKQSSAEGMRVKQRWRMLGSLEAFHVGDELVQFGFRLAIFRLGFLYIEQSLSEHTHIIRRASRTSYFFSHWSRSCSSRCTWRSKCSALTSTCRSLYVARSIRVARARGLRLLRTSPSRP